MKVYKFITIAEDTDQTFNDNPVYHIYNNKSNSQLGIIFYYEHWGQYILAPVKDTIFSVSCLKDIEDFIENEISK